MRRLDAAGGVQQKHGRINAAPRHLRALRMTVAEVAHRRYSSPLSRPRHLRCQPREAAPDPAHINPTPAMPDTLPPAPKCLSHQVADSLDYYFSQLNGHTPPGDLYGMVLNQVEGPLLAKVLQHCDGKQSRAAAVLGMNRATLRKKLRQHGLLDSAS